MFKNIVVKTKICKRNRKTKFYIGCIANAISILVETLLFKTKITNKSYNHRLINTIRMVVC